MSQSHDHIPVVDLSDLTSSQHAAQTRAADAILKGFGQFGLIYIRNHSIEGATLDEFYSDFLSFCARPDEEKAKVGCPDIWYQRGWTPPNTEQAVVAGGQPDFKECYFIAPEPLDEVAKTQFPQVYADNVWPEGLARFQERYMEIGHQLHEVGLGLLRGCARALGLPPYSIEAAVYGGAHVTRALRYLPLSQEQVGTGILWGEEHTDFNLLTLLPGGHFYDPNGERCGRPDPKCGLYLRTRPTPEHPQGEMLSGTPPAGCIVAQVGQELEILTGGRLLATPHVIYAPDKPGFSRTSMAHFIHLHAHQILAPLAPFRSPEVIKAYSPPVLAGTYAHKTLIDIGLAPRETLDQLGYRHYDRLSGWRATQ
jgi:isopenicillin N synthase-like dioxygenase